MSRWKQIESVYQSALGRDEGQRAAFLDQACGGDEELRREVESFLRQSGRLPRRPPANCLERSLGAYRLLCRAGASPALVVGMRRGSRTGVDGHVWVVVDGRPLAENETFLAGFGRVLAFDASGRQISGAADPIPDGLRLGT